MAGIIWEKYCHKYIFQAGFRRLLGKTIKLCTWPRGSARVATCPVLWMCINIDVRVPGAGPDLDTPPCIIQTVAGRSSGNDPLCSRVPLFLHQYHWWIHNIWKRCLSGITNSDRQHNFNIETGRLAKNSFSLLLGKCLQFADRQYNFNIVTIAD